MRFRVIEAPERLDRGAMLRYRLRLFGVPISWRTEITHWRPPRTFTDAQRSGPYAVWVHVHRLTPVGGGTEIYDHVRYRIPGGAAARLAESLVARWLDEIFDFRRERLAALLGEG